MKDGRWRLEVGRFNQKGGWKQSLSFGLRIKVSGFRVVWRMETITVFRLTRHLCREYR